jgi:hypothetical protein
MAGIEMLPRPLDRATSQHLDTMTQESTEFALARPEDAEVILQRLKSKSDTMH